MYDIAVIGLGPAGATLARLLDKRFNVIAIDRKSFGSPQGFKKACGGLLALDSACELALALNTYCKNPNRIYKKRTLPIRLKLIAKRLKMPFMYRPLLRKLVMKSGLKAVKVLKYDD